MESYFNAEQQAHMAYLASVPRDQRCGSGWHVKAQEACRCSDRHECECRHALSIHGVDGCRGRFNLVDRSAVGACPCRHPAGEQREGGDGE